MTNLNKPTDNKVNFQNDITEGQSKFELMTRFIKDKQKYIIIGSIAGAIAVGISVGVFKYQENITTLYHVYVDGEKIGTIDNKALIDSWKKHELRAAQYKYEDITLESDNVITFEEERKYKGSYDNIKALTALKSKFEIQAKGIEIIVDGEVVGIVIDQATAERLINDIKQEYLPESIKNKVAIAAFDESSDKEITVESIRIQENVAYKEVEITPDEVTSQEDMYTLLRKGTLEEKIYTVQKGDTISEIAMMFDLTIGQVYQLNLGLSGELIHIGDELIVTAMTPLVTVETSETLTQIEEILYKRITKRDDSMYVNETKVLVKGEKGQKEVKYSLLKENGIITKKEILNEKVLKEPKEMVIAKGTKIVPSRGSGEFDWPTVGGFITSYFGPRWGSYHNAIDISGVKDYTIKAADNGTIEFAGWKGSYGYAVIINHGNGIKTLYAHMRKITVSRGANVAKGQKIGVMGNTGRSTGTHLHFEVIVNGVKKNPLNYVGI